MFETRKQHGTCMQVVEIFNLTFHVQLEFVVIVVWNTKTVGQSKKYEV